MKSVLASSVFAVTLGVASSASALGNDEGSEGNWASEAPESGEKSDASEGPKKTASDDDSDDSDDSSGDAGEDADGARFRWGISGGGGFLALSDASGSATLGYGGADLRLGAQINDLVGIYAQPQLGFYNGTIGTVSGIGGIAGVTGLVDFTFDNTFFIAGGVGYGLVNSPSGAELHFRGGMYPLLGGGEKEARRHALMVGIDFRVFLLSGVSAISPTISLGYEAF